MATSGAPTSALSWALSGALSRARSWCAGVAVGEAALPCWVVNAKVPETGCPSAEVTRHSTV